MNDERVFEMLDEGIAYVVNTLEDVKALHPFAMVLNSDDAVGSLKNDERDQEKCYELLLEELKEEVAKGDIRAVALFARVTIPADFLPAVPEGIRIHIEERESSKEKIGARMLYVPYQLFKTGGDGKGLQVKLHEPIPVGFPSEIF